MPIPKKDSEFTGDRVQVNMLDVNRAVRCTHLRQFVRFAEASLKIESSLLSFEGVSVATGVRCGTYVICWGRKKRGRSDGGCVGGGDSRASEQLRITIRFHQRTTEGKRGRTG